MNASRWRGVMVIREGGKVRQLSGGVIVSERCESC